ncbi:MAG: DUF2017 family protein [Actinomycetota bacterium]
MINWSRRLFAPRRDGRFDVRLAPEVRLGIVSLAEQLDEVQSGDGPETRRLFPTAYPDDPDRDAGYQIFARDQLISKRREAVEIIRATAEADVLTGEQLSSWMGILNDIRLVLGTTLDISEDDEGVDPDAPDAESRLLYQFLGELVHEMVMSLTTTLPEPEDDDPAGENG